MHACGTLRELLLSHERDFFSAAFCADLQRLGARLAPGFAEQGQAGLTYGRETVLDALSALSRDRPIEIAGFQVRLLAPGAALARYASIHLDLGRTVLRSSIWVQGKGGDWAMAFHQGTPAPGGGRCFCGHDCWRCKVYLATILDDDSLRREAASYYAQAFELNVDPANLRCMGGCGEDTFYLCRSCPWASCCKERGLSSCLECPAPCGDFRGYHAQYVNKANQV